MSDQHIARTYFQKGMADFMANDFTKSIENLSRAIDLDPQFKLALASRGVAHLKTGQPEKAI